ncbi:histone-lysine N-methyltransferase SETMAR-like protein [Histomonas meleagridis]|uniref:histone-lysine N-methyltransferase SETMAR-like protein n=1 Tax=Histomonas meleagridis TaxID=135588 RepID=UPI0035594CD0|nr:histone-lysine N-methyltransferase SETMAR-like protein [Histomonas meleagridis]KAH0800199.1 histone-lysine N-methyltransferase SETMAR-like protein [Histomonas meleagridis]
MHMDNATPHRSRETKKFAIKNGLSLCPHPAFSPDLAPSDFYLFGKVKNELKGSGFVSEDELFEAIKSILEKITRDELESVFREWERRLQACIDNGGDYIE